MADTLQNRIRINNDKLEKKTYTHMHKCNMENDQLGYSTTEKGKNVRTES